MKSKGRQPAQPEECGVWLDAAELKRKKRPQQTFLPYSNRFNPLLRRPNVDSGVIEFTQTKTPNLCTKQTSMKAFFTPRNKTKSQPTNKGNLNVRPCKREDADDTRVLSIESLSHSNPSDGIEDSLVEQGLYKSSPYRNTQDPVQLCEQPSDTGYIVTDDHRKNISGVDEGRSQSSTEISLLAINKTSSELLLRSPVRSLCPEPHKVLCADSQMDHQLFTQDTQGNLVIAHRSTNMSQKLCHLSGPLHDRTNAIWNTLSPMKKNHHNPCDEGSLQNMFTQDSEGNLVIKH